MKKGIALLALASICVAAQSQTLVDDFSVGIADYVLPTDPNYGANFSTLTDPLFNSRAIGAANYGGNGTDLFVVHEPGSGTLTGTGNGSASGLMNLTYSNGGPVDLTPYASFTLHVNSLTAPVSVFWGSYSNAYNDLAGQSFTISSAGNVTFNLASLAGPFDESAANDVFFQFGISAGQSVTFSRLTANAVPEPASLAGMGFGIASLALLRRRRAPLS